MRPHYSEDWYQAVLKKHGKAGAVVAAVRQSQEKRLPSRYRSKLEAAWANHLNMLMCVPRSEGGIQHWRYEPVSFILPGQKNRYKVDFSAWNEHEVVFFEIKGHNRSDDRSLVKMKTAAGLNPWARFILVKRIKHEWVEKVIR